MPRKNKIDTIRNKVIADYRTGTFTRPELSRIYRVSRASIDTILNGVTKPISYDVLTQRKHVSLDQLKAQGREPGSYRDDPYTMIDNEPEYTRIVVCPHCPKKYTAHNLLTHLIQVHHRHDLEYLL